MSLSKKKILLSAAVAVTAGLFMSGCGEKVSTTTPIVAPVVSKAALTVAGTIVDASTLLPIGDVNVTYGGTGTATIIEKSATSDTTTGVVAFASTATTTNVNIQVHKTGYVDTGLQLNLVDVNESSFEIRMVKIDAAPTGVAVKQQDVLASENVDGTIQNAIEVSTTVTNSATSNGETTKIVIPADTVLTSSTGAKVTGALKTVVTHYSANESNSTQSFPGGFAVLATTSEPNATTATTEDISFVTAGFTSVVIQNDQGEKVKNFSKPIEVKMQIKEGTTNPQTSAAIAIGDTVPVWSYNQDTGKWAYEQDGTVADLNTTDGFYDVTVAATHLSYWNLDWHYSASCSNKITINLKEGGNLVTGPNVYMRANFKNASGYLYSGYIYGDGFATLAKVPLNKEVQINAYKDYASTTPLNSTPLTLNLTSCVNETHDLNINTSTLPTNFTQQVKVREVCENGVENSAGVANVLVYKYVNGSYSGYKYTDATGIATFPSAVKDATGSLTKYLVRVGNVSGWVHPNGYYDTLNPSLAVILTDTVKLTGNTAKCLDTGSTGGTN
jgi:hypothetical protein